ncbi:MAG: hypothetical protein IKI17_06820 [Oscillospiraceae bacterium]|nr:hypothetical protein [Oscillospiraceae bacterium]
MQTPYAPARPLREAYHSTAEFSGYVKHCGPTAVTNLLLSLLPAPPPAKALFRKVAELGRQKLVYVNRNLPLGLGGTSDALTGSYLRAALRMCGLTGVQIGLRRPLTERFARAALGRGSLLYIQLRRHRKYGSHHILCYGMEPDGSLRLADGWAAAPVRLRVKDLGLAFCLELRFPGAER